MSQTDPSGDDSGVSELSERQRQVLEAIARRRTIKQVSFDLGISPSRVNQYVRALKDRFEVESLTELAELWNAGAADTPSTKDTWTKKQLHEPRGPGHQRATADAAMLQFRDAGAVTLTAPWERDELKRVGPGLLDGPGATAKRMGFILLIAIGLPVAVVVTLSAMIALSEMLRALS